MFKRVVFLAAVVLLAGLFVTGCSSSDSTEPNTATAKIRIVNATPDGGAIDVYIGTSATPWLEDLEYGQASTYLTRDTGTVTLVIHGAGADPQLLPPYLTEQVEMDAGASLTSVVAGLVKSGADEDIVRLITYSDNFQNSPSARARVVHAGSDTPNLTVTIGATGQVLALNLERWAESGRAGNVYEAGTIQDIAVQTAGNQVTSFRAPELEAQKDYYFILTGLITGQGAVTTAFDLLIVGPGGVLALEPDDPRSIRLVHTSTDLGAVDYYMTHGLGDGFQRILVKDNVGYGDATLYSQMDIRQVFMEMYSVGENPDVVQPKFSQTVHLHDEAATTTAFAAGLAASQEPEDTLRLFSLADDFGVTIGGVLPARIVHTCANLDSLKVTFDYGGSIVTTVDRFAGNNEGAVGLPAETKLTMVVRDGSGVVDTFTTAAMAGDKQFYLILAGIKDGSPEFSLLSVTQDESLGFTPPN